LKQSLPVTIISDPDPTYQHHIVQALSSSFQCIVTKNLRETYQAIQQEHPTLVTLELDQPDGDGLALIRFLQEDVQLRSILIACVTRRATVKEKIQAFRAGADDYLVKPLTPAMNFYGRMLLLVRAGHFARSVR
jgi:DNA-binding response OmpR family regulator